MRRRCYVVALCSDPATGQILLLRKRRPAWQAGLLNGPGGKVEAGETPAEAAVRELAEETTIALGVDDLDHLCTLAGDSDGTGGTFQVDFFRAFCPADQLTAAAGNPPTDEQLEVHHVDDLPASMHANLRWLVPLAADPALRYQPFEVYERPWPAGGQPDSPRCRNTAI